MDYIEPYICKDLQNIIFDYKAQLDHWERVKFINHQIGCYKHVMKSIEHDKAFTVYYDYYYHKYECHPSDIHKFHICWHGKFNLCHHGFPIK